MTTTWPDCQLPENENNETQIGDQVAGPVAMGYLPY